MMWPALTLSWLLVATLAAATVLAAARVDAVELMFRNECGKDMQVSNGKKAEKINKDGYLMKTLEVGAIEAFRYGTGNQATLAEFSVKESTTWYDISIIPTGTNTGPGNCTSLAECKAVTGGAGFNVPMKIVPGFKGDEFFSDTCMTVNCFEDGCPDAYQHPNDPDKTRNCPSSAHFAVVFCATPATGSSDGSLGWKGQFTSAKIEAPAATTPVPSATPTAPPPQVVSTARGDDGGDGTSVAVILASIVGGFVTIFAAFILVRRFRYTRLEKMNAARYSTSDAVMYAEARDSGAL